MSTFSCDSPSALNDAQRQLLSVESHSS
eukprot:COSAG06_NODE_32387_length_507_cov_0.720588_2_plen_27_part_01